MGPVIRPRAPADCVYVVIRHCIEHIMHLLTQCPYYQGDSDIMYAEIFKECPNAIRSFEENRGEVPYFLLIRSIPQWEEKELTRLYGVFQAKVYVICIVRL